MRVKLLVRMATAALFGVLFGMVVHAGYVKWNRLGLDAFLAYETTFRFNRYMAHPKPEVLTLVTSCILALFVAGSYELVVAGISKLLKAK